MHKPNVSRRQFLAGLGAAAAAGLVGCGSDTAVGGVPQPVTVDPALATGERPNFVFVLTDDHRWDHLGAQGHPFLQTPRLDRLAQEGILFENAFVTTSLCSPSRASILTGQHARRHGIQNNLTPWQDNTQTFLQQLATAGYRNAFIGKWHMPGSLPDLRGVEQFITFTVQGGQGRYFDCPLIINGIETPRPDTYITTDLTDFALDFLRDQRDDAPFCLYLSHKAVHHQFLPPDDLKGLYADVPLTDLLPEEYFSLQTLIHRNLWEGALGPMERHYRNYCAALTAVDRELGRLLDELDALGLADNTVVVYLGDNGYSWGEHVLTGKRWSSEENLRVPCIVRYPEGIATAGRRAADMVLNIDIAPTFLALAGVPVPDEMQGADITPLLRDAPTAWRDAFFYEYFEDFPYNVPAQQALRTEQYLYVEYGRGRDPAVFDVIKDPRTLVNLIDTPEGQAILPELQARLAVEREAAT